MTSRFVCAIAADRKIRDVRERCEQIEQVARVGTLHLAQILPRKRLPARGIICCLLSDFQQRLAGRHAGHPDVVDVLQGERLLTHAARWPTDRAQAKSLVRDTGCAEPNNADSHAPYHRAARSRSRWGRSLTLAVGPLAHARGGAARSPRGRAARSRSPWGRSLTLAVGGSLTLVAALFAGAKRSAPPAPKGPAPPDREAIGPHWSRSDQPHRPAGPAPPDREAIDPC